jgi:sphinganine-1-phosphate aldolase
MVLPSTTHAAFHKAAHYFGVEPIMIEVGADFRADPVAIAAAIDDRAVLVVASAPSYAHGVVDPVTEIAAAAAARGVRCHVDACIGGWVLPYAARLGRPVPPWTFAADGVTSISLDLHKYAYAPKGTWILLHSTAELRRPQFFAPARRPGYTMLNATVRSTKSGGPLAGAWVTVRSIGDEGYLALADQALTAIDAIVTGVADLLGLSPVVAPDSTLLALGTDDTCDPFTVCDELADRGWYAQPQLAFAGRPATIHLSVSAATAPLVPELLRALREAVAAAVDAGPVVADQRLVSVAATLDPSALTADQFDQLLAAAGLSVGDGLALPERRAGINALLDAVDPRCARRC